MKTNLLNQITMLGANSRRWIVSFFTISLLLSIFLFSGEVWGQTVKSNTISIDAKTPSSSIPVVLKGTKAPERIIRSDFQKDLWKNEPFGQYKSENEINDRRSENEKHFQREDGQVDMFVSSNPVNFLDNGNWKTIYNTIIEDNNGIYKFSNLNNTFKSYYPENIQDGFKSILNGQELLEMRNATMYYESNGQKLDVLNINSSKGSVNGNKLTYEKVYGNAIDLLVTQSGGKRKLDYIIKDRSAVNEAYSNAQYLVFSEEILLPKGWSVKMENGVILLIDDSGEVASAYEKPTVFDSNEGQENKSNLNTSNFDASLAFFKAKASGDSNGKLNFQINENISYDIQLINDKLTILTKVDLNYLFDENRVYPIFVDPTLTATHNNNNTWFYSFQSPYGPPQVTTSGAPAGSSITNTNVVFNPSINLIWLNGWYWYTGYCGSWHSYGLFDWQPGSPTYGYGPTNIITSCGGNTNWFNCYNPNRIWLSQLISMDGDYYASRYGFTMTITYETVSAPTSVSGTTTICAGSSTTLTASGGSANAGSTAITTQWFTGSCGGTLVGTGNSITVSPTSTTTYFVRRVGQCSTTGCASVTVTVQSPPTAPTSISGTNTICSGQSTTLTAAGGSNGSGATFQWGTGTVGSNVIAGQTSATLTVSPTVTTTYWVRRVGNTACTSTTGGTSISVTVTPSVGTPTAITVSSGTEPTCQLASSGATTTYATTAANSTGFNWSVSPAGAGTINATTGVMTWTLGFSGTATITVAANGCSGPSAPVTRNVTINASSTAPALSGTSPVCPATSVVLNAAGGTASPGSTINWYTGANGTGSFLGTGSSYTVTPSATSTYYARREGGCNTTADGTYTITVNGPTGIAPTTGDMVWRGAATTDWATLGNWWQYNGTSYGAASAAPTAAQNVIIPAAGTACILNQPNTNANAGSAKTLRIESGATLTMGNGTLTVAENWVNNGTFAPGTGTVAFTGTGTHTISGISGAHNFHNLTMNKDGEVQLSVPIAMSGALTLSIGRLDIGNSNLDLASNTVNGGNANSYVRTSGTGVLMRNVGASMVEFPVGRAAYNPAFIANAGTLDKFNVRVIDNVTDDGTAVGAQTTMAVVNRTWMIDEQVAGGSDVNLTLQWNGPAEEVNNFSESSAFIAHYMAADGLWDNIGGAVQTPGVIQAGGITSFSPFTVSSDNSFAPLPVKLTSFQANCTDKGYNSITWQTESETNSSHFIVERSRDGAVWSTVSSLPAAGTSVELKNYVISDISAGANFEGYYRLRQVDFDGEQEVFGPISINCDHMEYDYVEVYPNPSNGNFKARVYSNRASANVLIKVCAANGKVVHQQMTNLEKGLTTLYFEQNQLEKGMYFIQIESENSKLEPQKLVIH